jgi:alkylation response protein AidB-like acyl-CoA dehydrogenase
VDLSYTDEDENFRRAVADWLNANAPTKERPRDPMGARQWDLNWQRRQFDGGYAGIDWPEVYGGRGLPLVRQLIWYEEYSAAGGPDIGCCFVGINHGGPTLIARGSEQQRRRHLPAILAGEEVWCQGFSEPGAGSDLASISTRGRVDGDELIVTGQKIWTSYADVADYQELLVRTEPGSERHRGLTWIICDMRSPGITVRPIEAMDGNADFCEVFYDDVRIPLTDVVGDPGDGWSVAMSTLAFERGTGFIKLQTELSRALENIVANAADLGVLEESDVAHALGDLRADVIAMRAMTYSMVSSVAKSGVRGPEGSMIKVFYADLAQRIHRAGMEILGARALDRDGEYRREIDEYLYSYAATVGGGASEVLRDVVGERILGLPRLR